MPARNMAEQAKGVGEPRNKDRISKRKRLAVVLVVGVTVALIAAGATYRLYTLGFLPFDEDREYSHSYLLKVDTDTLENYTLMVPIPLNSTGAPYPNFLDELIDPQDELDVTIVDTIHGKALKLSGSEDATLRWSASWDAEDGDWYVNLSMTPGDAFDYGYDLRESWVYSGREDVRVSLSYSAMQTRQATPVWTSGGGPHYLLNGNDGDLTLELQAGWQNATIEYGYVVTN